MNMKEQMMHHTPLLRLVLLLLATVSALSGVRAQPAPPVMRDNILGMLMRARATDDQNWPQVRQQMLAMVQTRLQNQNPGKDAAVAAAITQIGQTLDDARPLNQVDFTTRREQFIDRIVTAITSVRGGAPPAAADLAQSSTRGLIDVHAHFMAVTPEQRLAAAQFAVQIMDKAGARMMLLMPPPGNGQSRAGIDYQLLLPAIQAHPGRFAFLGGGQCLNDMIQQTAQQTVVTDACRRQFTAQAEDVLQHGARGFGEMSILHVSWGSHHPYECTHGDHPLFLLLADIAARHNVPIDMHMDLATQDLPTPERLLGTTLNPATLKENLSGFERLLDHNPQAKIVWEHFGTDTLGFWTPALTRALLAKHPNLYIGLRLALGPGDFPATAPFESGRLKPDWLSLLKDYPDRFMIGSDTFVCPPGFAGNPDVVKVTEMPAMPYQSTRVLLNQLPPDLARKICYENAMALYGLQN
jgi:hypothetical protein